jgi:hypothetical protein
MSAGTLLEGRSTLLWMWRNEGRAIYVSHGRHSALGPSSALGLSRSHQGHSSDGAEP